MQLAGLRAAVIETKLGPMVAVADDRVLYLLEFTDQARWRYHLGRRAMFKGAPIPLGTGRPIRSVTAELDAYFAGTLERFTTPFQPIGTPFQQTVWHALRQVPYGQTSNYSTQAATVGHPRACRAVGNANRVNPIALLLPCHRIIQRNGEIGGYAGGIARKRWLLAHESRHRSSGAPLDQKCQAKNPHPVLI